MTSLWSILMVAHLLGLGLALGAATIKSVLLMKSAADPTFMPVYLKVAKPITRHIVLGLLLLTLSGIGWLLLGARFTPALTVKMALVAAIWVLGPVIDNVVEPSIRKLAPASGQPMSASFVEARRRMVAMELVATLLLYVVVAV